MSNSYSVSCPDLRAVVQDASFDAHEMTLVIADLGVARIFYARLLVDEGATFREHAVAYVQEQWAHLVPRLRKLLSMARPTQVTAISLNSDQEVILVGEEQSKTEKPSTRQARHAAAAVARQVLLTLPHLTELSLDEARRLWTAWYAQQLVLDHNNITIRFAGVETGSNSHVRVIRQGQFFEVEF